jgi:hypothetical protein
VCGVHCENFVWIGLTADAGEVLSFYSGVLFLIVFSNALTGEGLYENNRG